ncbi:MAG: NAD+ synthase, partial [Actinobacteria bacterium]|nr:NAD+ synthase [Actinomycetota bacterium]
MRQLRLALAQVNSTVGDIAANLDAVLRRCAQAAAAGAHVVAFPELMLTGYPPEDLVLRASFRAASITARNHLAAELAERGLGHLAVIVGYVDDDGGPRNAAAFITGGQVVARYFKFHLPNYGVFDERRYFVQGDRFVVVRFAGVDIALTVCEDAWQDGGPFTVARTARAGLVININASPYEANKDEVRLPLISRRAREAAATVAYVNTVGGQDELVFDGDTFIVDASGSLIARAPQYVEQLVITDLTLPAALGPAGDAPDGRLPMRIERHDTATAAAAPYEPVAPVVADRIGDEAEIWSALVLGLRDYVTKNGFRSVVIAMSGGIDSAVVAAIAADAVGGQNVYGVSLPSSYSSEHSRSDADELARRIGARYRVIPIAPMVDAFVGTLA